MRSQSTVFTPQAPDTFHKGHIHFFDYLDSFHGLDDQKDYGQQQNEIMEKLRNQYLNDNRWEENLCFRNCFKLHEQKYVQFCLDRKCGGVPLKSAAYALGYVRTGERRQTDSHGHH